MFFAVEVFLRYGSTTYHTYLEENGGKGYTSPFAEAAPSWFRTHRPNQEIMYYLPEFTHVRRTNSIGLADQEIPVGKDPNEYRVIALGDSYTEGIGTGPDSTWIRVVENHLVDAIPDRPVRTLNAGISGSDVFFEYVLLRDRLGAYNPDLVIVATNVSDVGDVLFRGGMARFRENGGFESTRSPPAWEWLFAISYTFRLVARTVLRYNWLFVRFDQMPAVQSAVVDSIKTAIDSLAALSQDRGFDLLIVLHPNDWEAKNGQWSLGFGNLAARLAADSTLHSLDLIQYYRHHEIIAPSTAADFYWPIDRHNNTRGYRAMGDAIADVIRRSGLLPPASSTDR
jgi:lysophospholipase L1-like esterase